MKLKVYKETSLPNELTTDSLYFVTGQGEYVDLFITGNTQGVVKRVISSNDIVTLIDEKVDQVDLETAEQQIELNRLAILTKADIAALAMLAQLVDTKADQAYVNQQIANLVGSAPEALNTFYELAAAIQDNAGIIDTLNQSVANRVRFDVATQALTEIQKQNARTNIGAETLGTAAQLVSQITAASIGAATTAQGTKADTALQSVDVAPVALSGLFNSLVGQNKIFDVVFGAYALGSNTAVVATDTLGQIIGKLQAQINNMGSGGGDSVTWVSAASIGLMHPDIPPTNNFIELARINGMLWIRGSFKNTGPIIYDSQPYLLRINDIQYKVVSRNQKGTLVANITAQNAENTKTVINFNNAYTTCVDAATASTCMQYFLITNTSLLTSNSFYNIPPTCLGVLVIK